jgi:hypothetical protein
VTNRELIIPRVISRSFAKASVEPKISHGPPRKRTLIRTCLQPSVFV